MNLVAAALVLAAAAIFYNASQRKKDRAHMSAASDRLAASVASLATSVDVAVAKLTTIPADDSAAEGAAADALDALKAKVDAAIAPPPVA